MTSTLSENVLDLAKKVILRESKVVATLLEQLGQGFLDTVDTMLNCHGHVLVSGAGTSNSVATRFAHLLSCCGTPALFIHPGDAQHGLSGAVTNQDVLFAISKGGETSEINHLARIAHSRGATIISLTEKTDSTLAKISDVVLCAKAPPDADPYGMIATGSSLFNSALCDAICEVLLKLRGYTLDAFGETHPGGAVGQKVSTQKSKEDLQ